MAVAVQGVLGILFSAGGLRPIDRKTVYYEQLQSDTIRWRFQYGWTPLPRGQPNKRRAIG